MKFRISQLLIIAVVLIPFSGCPRIPEISPGVWVFSTADDEIGVDLGVDGLVRTPNPFPPEANASFPFGTGLTLVWAQDGSTFTMTREVDSIVTRVYTGTVDSSTSIVDGTIQIDGSMSGTWTGMKL